ncbi:hypothetical protein niasHT_036978 [Heterodera trifolii]|uniref:Peptidase M41 domain-containing protein n=1 Tax=Heterodera trifolii TaxID=157864 RepID=A0ABD2IJT8_9BILA
MEDFVNFSQCFVAVFGEETDVFSGRLLPILEQFYRDSDDEVRSIIASGFHEIVAQHKIAPMGSKNAKNSSSISASVPLLLGPFVDLLSSGNADIVQQLTANLHRILQILYAEISASGTKNRTHLIFAKLDRILVNCNNLMKGSGSWRAHEAYLNGIAVLRNLVSTKDLLSNFVSLLKQEVLTARALPCRIAAAQTLLLMMREFATSRARQNIVKFFVHEIGHHSSCYRRRLLLHTELSLLQYFSREIFIDKFLPAVLKLYADQISNIRLVYCTILHFDELIIRASFHESGHTLLLYLLKDADQHIRTVLIRRPVFTFGMTVAKPRENYSQKQLVARLQMQFGGTVAESLKFGNVVLDNHDKSDRLYCGSISRCTSVSGNMVILLVSNEINSTGCCTLLLPCIIQLCKDEDPSVREAILSSMALYLPHFSKDAKKPVLLPLLRNLDFACQQNATNATQQQTTAQKQVSVENGTPPAVAGNAQQQKLQQLCVACRRMCAYNFPHLIFAKLDRILVNCNNLMKGSGSWRAHEAYLNGIAVLRNLVSTKDLLSNFVSLLKQEVLTARALPCRIAAAQTLLLMMREFATSRARQNIVKFFVHEIGARIAGIRTERNFTTTHPTGALFYAQPQNFIPIHRQFTLPELDSLPQHRQNRAQKLQDDAKKALFALFVKGKTEKKINAKCQHNGVTFSLVDESIYDLLAQSFTIDELIIRASFHESGHTLLLYLLKDADQHIRTVLIRRPVFTFGMTVAKPRENYSQKQLVARLQMQFGGTVAESLKFGNVVLDNHDKSDRLYCARYIVIDFVILKI